MLFCGMFLRMFADSSVIAEIDGVPLYLGSLNVEAKKMLPDAALAPDVREVKLRAAVMTELKIRETLDILNQKNIVCSPDTARWYIMERTKNSKLSENALAQGLRQLVDDRSFQLKCAIYKYLTITCPEKLAIAPGSAESFYFQNQLKYRINTPGIYKVISIPAGNQNSVSAAEDIRFALLQGEAPEQVAVRSGAKCVLSTPEIALQIQRLNLRKNGVSDVVLLNGQRCVAVCVAEPENGFIPFKQLEQLIEEELISRRAGAIFDEILKTRLSRKNIKYRR